MKLKHLFVFVLLACAGCGYQFSGVGVALPEGITRVKVDLFVNQTTEPYLETVMTEAMTYRLMRLHEVKLVEENSAAEAILSGTILKYNVSASAYDAINAIQAYRVTLKVKANLKRVSDGKVLWQGNSVRYEDFVSSNVTITAEEDLAVKTRNRIAARIAEDFSWQMATGFGAD